MTPGVPELGGAGLLGKQPPDRGAGSRAGPECLRVQAGALGWTWRDPEGTYTGKEWEDLPGCARSSMGERERDHLTKVSGDL